MAILKKGQNWVIDYYHNGRRIREVVGPNKREAEMVLGKRKAAIREGRFFDSRKNEKITFSQFVPIYIEQHARRKRSYEKSDKCYLKHLVPFFGDRYLYNITEESINDYKQIRAKEVCVASVNRELACIKCIFSKAVAWKKLKDNPAKNIKLEKENNKRTRFLSTEEAKILLENCSSKLQAIVAVAISTGMRKGEIQNLKWSDVDLSNQCITLRETKNGELRQFVVSPVIWKVLASVKRHPSGPYVFSSESGGQYDFRTAFTTALIKSNITDFHFHDLRHTFASWQAMLGTNMSTIGFLLGHKTPGMTTRYAHLSKEYQAKIVGGIDKLLPDLNSQTVKKLPAAEENELGTSGSGI